MTRIRLRHVRVVSSLLLIAVVAACGRPGSSARSETRERAYRANNIGVAQLERFSYPEAADAFRQALQIDSTLAIAHLNLSLALLYMLDYAGAATEATEAARLLPGAPQPPYVLGLVARAENRTADALRAFERVRQIDASDVGTNVNLGQMYLEDRKYAEAIAVLKPAAATEPYNVSAAYNLGLALTRSGQEADGQVELRRAQALRSTGYAVTYATGYLEQGHYAEAVASTGAEPELVDQAVPAVSFTPTVIAQVGNPDTRPRSPFGQTFTAADLAGDGMRRIAAGLGGGLTLLDADGDGDLDLFVALPEGQALFRNDGHAAFADVTAESGLSIDAKTTVPIGCVAGDYDNDGRPDLFVLRAGGSALYHNEGGGRFRDVTAEANIPPYPFLPGAAAMVDVDHDGDLDIVIAGLADIAGSATAAGSRSLTFPRDFAPAPLRLLRNNGNGSFTDITKTARLDVLTHAVAIVPTDFDNRRDVDLLIVNRDTPPLLFQNFRDGTFRDVAAAVGLSKAVGSGEVVAVTAADVNKDDFPDFYFARSTGGVLVSSDGRGGFTASPGPEGLRPDRAVQFADYDNDGLIDLLAWSADGPRAFRNASTGWLDVSSAALPRPTGSALAPASPRGVAMADLDADGAIDAVTSGPGGIALWRNTASGAARGLSERVTLAGRVSNRLGIGSKVQIRAGSLAGRIETSAATPNVAPADIVFGLGRRTAVDTVRVLWPSGTLQAESAPPPGPGTVPGTAAQGSAAQGSAAPGLPAPFLVQELDRKPSSCPFLYTWNGERFEFITDFMGGGEMGYLESPGVRNQPDPLEYVRITGDQLKPRDGRLELRVTNELEETLFADRLQLLAVAHPSEVTVYPNEGMSDPAKPFRIFAVTGERVPHATDDHGHDVTERVAKIDRRYPDDFRLERFRGYAAPHALVLDLSPVPARPVLLLTAWTDYAFSSDNVAAQQAGLMLTVPTLEVRDTAGRWRTEIADIGIPVGRPQTVPLDLTGHLHAGEHEVRIATNMRIYWDRAVVASGVAGGVASGVTSRVTSAATSAVPGGALQIVTLDPLTATLAERGFSAEVRPDGQDPPSYDYARLSHASPWKTMPGRYTRAGDVRPLLIASDDLFVIAKPGDEIALTFADPGADALPAGWTRTYLLRADGFSKEMDINSASPDTVEPLPFHRMTGYPYRPSEHYPDTPETRQYQDSYNTRLVRRTVPSMDLTGLR